MFTSRIAGPGTLILVGMFACASPAARNPAQPIAQAQELGAALDRYLKRAVPFGFSGVLLIAKDDRVILHEGYGLADTEQRLPLTAETVLSIGSITKQFTAAAILKLEEEGRLRLEDSIGRFFSGVPADKRGITLHHLLTHTAGLIGDLGGDYQVMPRDSLVKLALASELQWPPGTRYDYSNLGYSLLGAIIELASGEPYERYLHDRLLRPAGLLKTGYRIPQWRLGEVAVGYRLGQRWGTPLERAWAPDGPWWNLRANGGILSTVGDLHRWHRALQGDLVLTAESRRKIFTPHAAEDAAGSSHYGYGWAIFTTPRGTKLIAHDGGNGYFFADFLRYVDEDVVIILATNDAAQNVLPIRDRVIGAVFSGRPPAPPPVPVVQLASDEQDGYVGTYLLPSGGRIVVSRIGGRLSADAVGQDAAELLTNSSAAMLPVHRELSMRATAIMVAAAGRGFAVLREASAEPDRSEQTLERIWRTAEQNLGVYRSFDVLGTVTNWWGGETGPVTFVRLNFEQGARLFRLHWENGRIVGYGGAVIPNPARTDLMPQGDHRFTGYNLGIEREVAVRFEPTSGGAVTALVIHGNVAGEEAVVTARRCQPTAGDAGNATSLCSE